MTKTGRIYKIIHNQSNLVYVGSTFNLLRQKWAQHKKDYKKGRIISIYTYFKKYGIENFKMILIKEYQVEDRAHMEAYGQLWINKLKPINKKDVFSMLKKQKAKRRNKEYYEKNREKRKKYREDNKDKIKAYRRLKGICDGCGKVMRKDSIKRHKETACKKQII